MNGNDKLIDAILDLGLGMKELREEMKGMCKDMNMQLDGLNQRVDGLSKRVEKLEKQQQKTNTELGEIRLTFIKYADTIQNVQDHEIAIYQAAYQPKMNIWQGKQPVVV